MKIHEVDLKVIKVRILEMSSDSSEFNRGVDYIINMIDGTVDDITIECVLRMVRYEDGENTAFNEGIDSALSLIQHSDEADEILDLYDDMVMLLS